MTSTEIVNQVWDSVDKYDHPDLEWSDVYDVVRATLLVLAEQVQPRHSVYATDFTNSFGHQTAKETAAWLRRLAFST